MYKNKSFEPSFWVASVLTYTLSVLVLIAGAILNVHEYPNPEFIIAAFWLQVVLLMIFLSSLAFMPQVSAGLRRWPRIGFTMTAPLIMLVIVSLGVWFYIRFSGNGNSEHGATSLLIYRTTLLVGFTEEWIYRGVLLVALSSVLGLKKGGFIALLMFSLLHGVNALSGEPVASVLIQMLATFLIGSIFLVATVGSKSLWPSIIGHGIYDFVLLDCIMLSGYGVDTKLTTFITLTAFFAGIYSLFRLVLIKDLVFDFEG